MVHGSVVSECLDGEFREALLQPGAADPVNITYGCHPYWTGGWNGVIIKAKELWKKHLPAGGTVHRGTCANGAVAAMIWEPHARRMVEAGHARSAATGTACDLPDADFTMMRQDFIDRNPEAAAGWIKAGIEAVRFMIEQPRETAKILAQELTGYSEQAAWAALYERNPAQIGGDPVNYVGSNWATGKRCAGNPSSTWPCP